jgi:hypothetical protein
MKFHAFLASFDEMGFDFSSAKYMYCKNV